MHVGIMSLMPLYKVYVCCAATLVVIPSFLLIRDAFKVLLICSLETL